LGVGEEPRLSADHKRSDGVFGWIMPTSELCRLGFASRLFCSTYVVSLAA
jgi:hypothetical protein